MPIVIALGVVGVLCTFGLGYLLTAMVHALVSFALLVMTSWVFWSLAMLFIVATFSLMFSN